MSRSQRDRVKNQFRVAARDRNTAKLVNDRDAFDLLCAEIASEQNWVGSYCDGVEWKRLVSETWNELREENWRLIEE